VKFFRRWLSNLQRAAVLTYESRCIGIAKGAAYSALLAFFPVLTTIAILLVRFKARDVSQVLARQLEQIVPPGSENLVLSQFVVRGTRPVAVLVGSILIAIYAASGIMLSLTEGFDATYRIPGRALIRQRLMAALLVVLAVVPAVAASTLILFGDRTERWALSSWVSGTVPAGGLLWVGRMARIAISLVCATLGAATLYRLAPNKPMAWREVWGGAVVATLLWYAATYAFRYYVANVANYNVLYGSVATVIALSVWLYLLALIALYGCAVNAINKRR
jgi:membrane protein